MSAGELPARRPTDDLIARLSCEASAVLDLAGVVREAGPGWSTVLGRAGPELLGVDLSTFAHADDLATWHRLLEALRSGREVRDVDLRLLHRTDRTRWVRVQAAPHPGEDAATIVVLDITDRLGREREQEELKRTRALLEEAQRLARLGHWEGDLEEHDLRWSPVVHEIFGLDPEGTLPSLATLQAMIHPDDREAVRAASEELRREGRQAVDYRVVRPDGEIRHVHQVARLSAGGAAPATRVLGTVQDVTELRAIEHALRDSQDQLRRVLAATNDGWWDLDLATGTSFYSERWWALCGYAPGELPADPEPWRQLTHPDDLPRFEAAFAEVLAAGDRTFVLPSAGLHRDGRRIPMVVRGLIERDRDGTPIRISGATSDVTEARQAEVAKERFLSTVSHELRTPLTAIGGALELLGGGVAGALTAQATELVEVARRNTERLRALIDDLLDLERLADEQPFHHRPQPLVPLLEVSLTDNGPYAATRGTRFVLDAPQTPVLVDVDRGRLEQVLANLLSNAVKFAPEGTAVEVRVRTDDTRGRVRVDVVDRGPGVPEGLRDRVFERFVQADPSDPRSRGGTGLGLSISRDIIERHGGRIGLDVEAGRTCFWFELPVASAGS